MSYIPLEPIDLILPALLVLINGALSLALQLGIERQLAVATLRMVIQLFLIGLVLTALFELVSPLWTGLAALAMIAFAGREIMARQERRLAGFWSYGLGFGSMLVAASDTILRINQAWSPVLARARCSANSAPVISPVPVGPQTDM